MKILKRIALLGILVTAAAAQSMAPPIEDTRLTIHTLVREDIFAGILTNDMERMARGERNIDLLLEKRPAARAELLAWKGGAAVERAVRALEANRPDEFRRKYQEAQAMLAEARKLGPNVDGVAAVTGGIFAVEADRLPKEERPAAWAQAYEAFKVMYGHQGNYLDKLPTHIRGELLGGLAMAAQRTGRTDEMNQWVDKILTYLPNTPYEGVAKKWKANPKSAASTSLACMTCHEDGRLSAKLAALEKK